ncbi:MAG: MHYT domain-containing protein [Bdellovibrionota bacterium]
MQTMYSPLLVFLSFIVAMLASYVALNFAHSVSHAKGRAQLVWLLCGSLAMGVGIWSMHFIGMLAFKMPGMDMAYDMPLLVLSVIVAVMASGLALYVVSRPAVPIASLISGGIAMAGAISGMHYIGMYSMRMAARIQWNIYLVLLSIVIALVASFASLLISIWFRNKPDRSSFMILASIIMGLAIGLAIAGMHYTGMEAATFFHDDSLIIQSSNLLVTEGLSVAVVMTTLFILGIALTSSVGQRFIDRQTKKTEEVLVSSEEKFRLLVEAVKDYAIFMLDPNGLITTWNSGAERITGFSDEDIIGKNFSTFYTPEDIARNITITALEIAREQKHFEGEALHVRKDGSRYWANIVINPLYSAEGTLTGFSKVTRDVTQLKETEEQMRNINEELERRVRERTLALEVREGQLRALTNAMPILVAQIDKNEKFIFANDSFCDWFNRSYQEIIGLTFREVLNEERYPINKPFIDRALTGEIVTYERNSKSGQREVILNITFVPEFDHKRNVMGFIIVASDVTKYKEIQTELKSAKEAAEVANATKSAFLANMSHEIRTPLGSVLGFSELMFSDDMTADEKQNHIEIIKRNGKLLSDIINDILDISKVEAGKMEIEKVDVPLKDLLNEAASLLNLEASGKGIKLTFSTEGLIPDVIKTDPTRLRQVLFNIIGNAIKFTKKGTVDVKIMLDPLKDSAKLAFVVKDTGAGIKPEQIDRLFSPFTQADVTTTRKFGGTGLGLVLSKKLAQALGGDVILESSISGQGSTFVVTIDHGHSAELMFERSSWKEESVTRVPVRETSPALSRLNILVVDDSLDNQALVKKLLKLAGAAVDTANNGREGIEKALSGNFNLVLMDLQMPEMDGYEATRELRRQGFNLPIIALTAHAMKEERKKCLDNGFNDHLTKPIDRMRLIDALSGYSI